jgi:hypothetical protein
MTQVNNEEEKKEGCLDGEVEQVSENVVEDVIVGWEENEIIDESSTSKVSSENGSAQVT